MKIGLCICAGNEEQWIVGALHSCYRAIDHAVIMINGSTDRTRALAEQYLIKAGVPYSLMTEPEAVGWPDHLYQRLFDEAEAQGTDWILLLDADERLAGQFRASLRELAGYPRADAYALSRRTVITPYCPTAGGEIEPYTDSLEVNENHLRFFRPGAVRYPEATGPHQGAQLQAGHSVVTRPLCPTDITHDRDGWEQMRRDRLRGQYTAADLVPYWQRCGGWFDYSAIYDLAVKECRAGGTMVELGNYLGRSLIYLGLKAQESGKQVRIVGADLFRSEPCGFHHVEIMEEGVRWLHRTATDLHRAGLAENVSLLQWSSWECAKLFENESVDFCFVDACHEPYAVEQDLARWWPKIRRGGLLAGHDYSPLFQPLVDVVNAWARREGLELHLDVSLGSWLVRKP